jgi:hypothetical protein
MRDARVFVVELLAEIRDLRKIIVQYQLVTGYEIGFLALQIELS